jgi:hypothetical protein
LTLNSEARMSFAKPIIQLLTTYDRTALPLV